MAEERLQKIIAAAGVTSRRKAEKLILEGRVMVNGAVGHRTGLQSGHRKRPHQSRRQAVARTAEACLYLALNKPRQYCDHGDDPERPSYGDGPDPRGEGRACIRWDGLDYHSEGLLLLTNDGEFANVLTSAGNHVPKIYLVKVNGTLSTEQEDQFRNGIPLSGRRTAPAGLRMSRRGENPWYEVRLIEGRNNQIRNMFKYFGLLVEKLKRIRIGPLELGSLEPGEFRRLSPREVEEFRRFVK